MPVVEIPFEVEQNYAGWRLDRYLQQKITRLSRAKIQKLIRERLRHEGGPLKPSSTVRAGMRFVLLKESDPELEPETPWQVGIVHDDGVLLVVDKPAGLAVHPSARYFKQTLTHWMEEHVPGPDGRRPDLAHRLDRETSGLVACGRGRDATRALKLSFARRETEKTYLALVEGRVEQDAFTIDSPLRLQERAVKIFMEVHPDGLPATTEVRVLRRGSIKGEGEGDGEGAGVSLVECRPITGRQHQIRVHLRSVGHPIVGDKMYSGEPERFLRFCDGQLTEEDQRALRIPRQALHAYGLVLPHPESRERISLVAPLAADLQRFVDESIVWDDETGFRVEEREAEARRSTG